MQGKSDGSRIVNLEKNGLKHDSSARKIQTTLQGINFLVLKYSEALVA